MQDAKHVLTSASSFRKIYPAVTKLTIFFSKARSEPSPLSIQMRAVVAFSVTEADILSEVCSTTQGMHRAAGDLRAKDLVTAKSASPVKAHLQSFPVAAKKPHRRPWSQLEQARHPACSSTAIQRVPCEETTGESKHVAKDPVFRERRCKSAIVAWRAYYRIRKRH